MAAENIPSNKEKRRQYYLKNKEKLRLYQRKYYSKNKGKIKQDQRLYDRKYYSRYRNKALVAYGGNPPKCACCGEEQKEFLAIDHIGGGGNKHGKHTVIARWLFKNNYPNGFRVLCHNCNFALGHYGYCPHGNPEVNNPKQEDTFEYNNKFRERKLNGCKVEPLVVRKLNKT